MPKIDLSFSIFSHARERDVREQKATEGALNSASESLFFLLLLALIHPHGRANK